MKMPYHQRIDSRNKSFMPNATMTMMNVKKEVPELDYFQRKR